MSQLYLLGPIGLPGSGKSTFLSRFCAEEKLFYWQNDEARRRIFKEPRHTRYEHEILSQAAQYSLEQSLQAGLSCIYDVNNNQYNHRHKLMSLAQQYGAEFRLLWFQVPIQVAEQRAQHRAAEATGELKAYYDTYRPDVVAAMASKLQPPRKDERVIVIDGTASYNDQKEQVLTALRLPS